MIRHTSSSVLVFLVVAGFAAGAPCAAPAAEGGIRQPLGPIGTPPGRPSGGPGMGRPTRPEPADDALSRLRRAPPEEPGQNGAAIKYRGTQYVVTEGQWYERRGHDLVAITAPSGVLVRELPKDHSMRWIGGVPYFYADGLYYVWREGSRRYEILQSPPSGEEAPAPGGSQESRRVPAP